MNTLEEQLAILVQKAIEVAENTGEFALEQAPLLLQEFYAWHLTEHIIYLTAALACLYLIKKIFLSIGKDEETNTHDYKLFSKWYDDESFLFFISCVFSFVGSIALLIGAFLNIIIIVKILIAPKLYLIEYFIK